MKIIANDERILDLQQQYEAAGMPWDPAVKGAIRSAVKNIKDPITQNITEQVAQLLAQELQRCLLKKGQGLLSRWLGKFKTLFNKNKTI